MKIADLIKIILKEIPNGSKLYIDESIEWIFQCGALDQLKKYSIEMNYFKNDWYRYCYDLNEPCINYLIEQLTQEDTLPNALCHYMIAKKNVIYLAVFDGEHIGIKQSLGLSKSILSACEESGMNIIIEENVMI